MPVNNFANAVASLNYRSRIDLAEDFEVAISTVDRWISGIAVPHPELQRQFYLGLGQGWNKMKDGDFCNCGCHKPGMFMMHVIACCDDCPKCGNRIQVDSWKKHQEDHWTMDNCSLGKLLLMVIPAAGTILSCPVHPEGHFIRGNEIIC